jgi:hypothetical protein
MRWCGQNSTVHRSGAVNPRLRSPFTRATHDLPLPKSAKEVILTSEIWRMSD